MSNLQNAWPRAFGGGQLSGDRLMRFVYLDEAGISDREPVTVVAGVVIDGDRQFRLLESYLHGLVEAYVPEDRRAGFAFHAKELANGGKTFVRGVYDEGSRLQALRKLAGIPRRFLLPIVIGWYRKTAIPGKEKLTPEKRANMSQALAYMQCAIAADAFMKQYAKIDEVAICVAENNDSARLAVRHAHNFLNATRPPELAFLNGGERLSRIVDTVHFAAKSEAVLLQIADVVAYVVARYINGAKGADLLIDIMTGGLGLPRDNFAAGAGHQVHTLYIGDKVVNQQAWYASKLVRSSPPVEGLQIVEQRTK